MCNNKKINKMFNASSFLMFSQEVQGKAQIHSDNLPNIRKKK